MSPAIRASPGPKIEQGGARGPTFASSSRDEPLRGHRGRTRSAHRQSPWTREGSGARASLDVVDNLVFVPPNRTGPDADRPGEPPGLHSFVDGRARKLGHRLHRTPLQQSHAYLLVARRATRRFTGSRSLQGTRVRAKPLKTRAESKAMECPQQDRGTTFRLPQACASSAAPGCRKRQRRSSSGETTRRNPSLRRVAPRPRSSGWASRRHRPPSGCVARVHEVAGNRDDGVRQPAVGDHDRRHRLAGRPPPGPPSRPASGTSSPSNRRHSRPHWTRERPHDWNACNGSGARSKPNRGPDPPRSPRLRTGRTGPRWKP